MKFSECCDAELNGLECSYCDGLEADEDENICDQCEGTGYIEGWAECSECGDQYELDDY